MHVLSIMRKRGVSEKKIVKKIMVNAWLVMWRLQAWHIIKVRESREEHFRVGE